MYKRQLYPIIMCTISEVVLGSIDSQLTTLGSIDSQLTTLGYSCMIGIDRRIGQNVRV